MFHEKISEINQGSQAFQKNSIDEYMIPIGNKIVFTNGDYDSPYIREIIEVLTDSQTEFEAIKECIYRDEKGESGKQDTLRYVQNVFGKGRVISYKSGNDGVYGWEDGKRKGKTRRTVVRNYLNKYYGRRNDNQINETEADLTGSASFMPDGTVFKFSQKNKEVKQEAYRGGTKNSSLANTTSFTSNKSISNSDENVNTKSNLGQNVDETQDLFSLSDEAGDIGPVGDFSTPLNTMYYGEDADTVDDIGPVKDMRGAETSVSDTEDIAPVVAENAITEAPNMFEYNFISWIKKQKRTIIGTLFECYVKAREKQKTRNQGFGSLW